MNGAFYIGAIGLDAQQRALEVVANNVANVNTAAFKRSTVQFSELVAPLRGADDLVLQPGGPSYLQGVTLSGTPLVWSQGAMQQTGQPMDIAINGEGFIELAGPSGRSLLWRGGALKINSDGYLATASGVLLRAMISVPQETTAITIGADGAVTAMVGDEGAAQQIGQIDLVTVKTPDMLVDTGNGYFEAQSESQLAVVKPGDDGAGFIVQGSLEGSNVQLVDEMTNLLLLQRAFGANAQLVQAGDQLMSLVNQLRR
ncbi:MAG TPA: flagellar hook-basal body complex protein [Rhizomicrobium sp.]|nr:flagellar hook-basal body complex protein [Rhizomicrobium sp.]